jgi:MFS family permease
MIAASVSRRDVGAGRWWALGALNLAVLAVGLDGTVLSVALPTLPRSLHASASDLQWFWSGYLLVLAAAMLPAGLLGDRYGRKRVMLAALALSVWARSPARTRRHPAHSSPLGCCSGLRVPE